jgi:transcription antitermination protein NusB
MKPAEATARRRAREAALQMLYQWEVGRTSPGDSILSYWPAQEDAAAALSEEHREFANALVRGTTQRLDEIDSLIARRAQNWRVERMAVLDRLVLRLATYELLADPGTPPRVVINEALELTRQYSGDEAVGFVNGVLDGVRKQLGRE